MTCYMYNAAFHCEECGKAIIDKLVTEAATKAATAIDYAIGGRLERDKDFIEDLRELVTEAMESRQTDSDDYPVSYPDAGESDTPQNCDSCHRPLDYTLTSDGIDYVVEEVQCMLKRGQAGYCEVRANDGSDYYGGSPAFAVVRDWVEDMRYYNLDSRRGRIFRYIAWMERRASIATA